MSSIRQIIYTPNSVERNEFSSVSGFQKQVNLEEIVWNIVVDEKCRTFCESYVAEKEIGGIIPKILLEAPERCVVLDGGDALFISIYIPKEFVEIDDDANIVLIYSENTLMLYTSVEWLFLAELEERILKSNGLLIRKRGADYLLYLIFEGVLESCEAAYAELEGSIFSEHDVNKEVEPQDTRAWEGIKMELFSLKKHLSNWRQMLGKLERLKFPSLEAQFSVDILEQVHAQTAEIDFALQHLESKTNLAYTVQGHKLNQIMKLLTVYSVIFIPLSFIVGLYGMNFENMPELHSQWGYPVLWAFMLFLSTFSIVYMRRKRWF